MSLRLTIPALAALASLLATVVSGLIAFSMSADALQQKGYDNLAAILESRASETRRYFGGVEQDLRLLSSQTFVIDALDEFSEGFRNYGEEAGQVLQRLYIDDNPNPIGEKQMLNSAGDGGLYDFAHSKHHASLRTFQEERGYYDLFLFNTEGDLVYSVFKERDYATNMDTGPWKDSDLANAFRAAKAFANARNYDDVIFFDFAEYGPSNDAPASFIAMPVRGRIGEFAGVMALQMPIDRITEVIGDRNGLGETGEALAVGPDQLMRTESRLTEGPDILTTRIENNAIAAALGGETGVGIEDGRLVAYQPLQFLGVTWALKASTDLAEANAGAIALRNSMLLAAILTIAVLIGVGFAISRTIVRPMQALTNEVGTIADGELDCEVSGKGRVDEVGAIARAVDVLRASAQEAQSLRDAREHDLETASEERRVARNALADEFERTIGGVAADLSAAADQLRSYAQALTGAVSRTRSETAAAAAASQSAKSNASSAATATEELSASSREIGRQVQDGADISQQAVAEASDTNVAVNGLAESA
ncbi:MAG: cache domain-containing protein, partial [Pseudomonadota bacterium]